MTKAPGQIAYEARFEGDPKRMWDAWDKLPTTVQHMWAHIEKRVQEPLLAQIKELKDALEKTLNP